ncbi:hypothetical protein BS17DRAFT_776680 [Gyrodon lividus]|nr:hypothetical protein BS17DRAFT_776680 [Gyrodon lividus]
MAAVHDSHVCCPSSAIQASLTHIPLPYATHDGVQLVREYSNTPQRRYRSTFLDNSGIQDSQVPSLPC